MHEDLTKLVGAAVDGDEDAYRTIVERYSSLVWSIIRSHRLSRADAEDAAQGVWVSMLHNLGRLREPERLAGWLATTTRNECLLIVRRSARSHPNDPADFDRYVATNTDVDRRLLTNERARAVNEALADVGERCRELIAMLGTDPPLNYQQISAALDLPVGAIGPTRLRCLEKIRRHRSILRLKPLSADSV